MARRVVSILLLLVFSFPVLASMFDGTRTAESRLLACCRRNGAHSCAMSASQLSNVLGGKGFTTAHSKCPIYPTPAGSFERSHSWFDESSGIFAELASHPAQRAQVEAWARVALDGARQKRGPPGVILS